MRPVRRGLCPIGGDYPDYKASLTDLVSRIGSGFNEGRQLGQYCSYCERRIPTNLAVEHIEPKKGPYGKPALKGRWENFLLACVNCNSTKGSKQVLLNELFLPDRDNTLNAFEYLPDGNIIPNPLLPPSERKIAKKTLALTGLDKKLRQSTDEQGRIIAEDRSSQRMQVWAEAEIALMDYQSDPSNRKVQRLIVSLALSSGFFSVWMTVFQSIPEMRIKFVESYSGTKESGCFDLQTGFPVSPAPNPDRLPFGGKI